MRAIQEKWRSRAGASFATAMGIFLICCMFAMAVISSGGSLAVGTVGQIVSEQEFLSVSCAAKLFTEVVENCSVYEKQVYNVSTGQPFPNLTYLTVGEYWVDALGQPGHTDDYDFVERTLANKVKRNAIVSSLNVTADYMNDVSVKIQFIRSGSTVTQDFRATVSAGGSTVTMTFQGREEPAVKAKYDTSDRLQATYKELKWSLQDVKKG